MLCCNTFLILFLASAVYVSVSMESRWIEDNGDATQWGELCQREIDGGMDAWLSVQTPDSRLQEGQASPCAHQSPADKSENDAWNLASWAPET